MSHINRIKCDVCGEEIGEKKMNPFEVPYISRHPSGAGFNYAYRFQRYLHSCDDCIAKLPKRWQELLGREKEEK